MRSLSRILVICIGLLALSSPAAACALVSLHADCCPAGEAPCGEGGTGSAIVPDASACCLAVPAPITTSVAESSRVRAPLDSPAAGPDPQLSLAWFLTLRSSEAMPIPISYAAPSRVGDASLTYLRTLRLRL